MRKILIFLFSFTLLLDPANAATKKATPTPTKKVTAKASAKATAKSTTKASAKPTAKSTTTKKPVPKKVYKPRPRKTVKLTPSPSPKWPPKGYSQNGDIYAKVPTKKELYSYSTSSKTVAKQLVTCKDFSCGAVFAGSQSGCTWWEFNSDLVGPTSETDPTVMKFGSLVSLFGSSKPKEVKAYILISQEDIKVGHKVSNIKIACHRDPIPSDLKVPSNTYVKSS
jgi:hypothetical protein